MRIQPIQTYSNRIYSVRFMQSKQNKQDPNGIPPETSEKGRSHSPAGVLITAAALPAVIIYSLTTSPKQEIKPEPKTPDSTTYLELFNQLMESPLINMPKVDPHILLRNGYEWVSRRGMDRQECDAIRRKTDRRQVFHHQVSDYSATLLN